MSYNTYNAPLTLKPCFSLQLTAFVVGLHVSAIFFVLLFFPASLFYKLCLVAIISLSAIYAYRLHIQKRLNGSIKQVKLSIDNQWSLVFAKRKNKVTARLLPSSMINRHLVILNFKLSSGVNHSVIMPNDAIDAALMRKMRARIRVMGL